MNKWMNAAAVLLFATSPLAAQQWSAEAHGGRIRSALDPASDTHESVAVGVRYDHSNSGLRISAGVPTTAEAPLWGAIAGSRRFAVRSGLFIAGLDIAANGFIVIDRTEGKRDIPGPFEPPVTAARQSGLAGAAQALPVIGIETARVQAHLRAGVSHYTSEIAEQRRNRQVAIGEAQVTFMPLSSIAVMPAVRHIIADEADYTNASITAVIAVAPLSVWASAGRWLHIENQDATWSAGASLQLHERAQLTTNARRDVLDPLYATPGQTSWSLGLSVKLGHITRMPVPAVVKAGAAEIRLPVAQAQAAPRVAGDFSAWKPQPMQRRGSFWVYPVALEPGVYNYAFVDGNGAWFVPEKHPGRKKDGMGGDVAVLVVR